MITENENTMGITVSQTLWPSALDTKANSMTAKVESATRQQKKESQSKVMLLNCSVIRYDHDVFSLSIEVYFLL